MSAARPRFRSSILWFSLLTMLLLPARLRAQAWVDALRQGTEVRFLFGAEVRRYDLAARTWLPAVTLPRGGATAMAWDAQNCYVAYGTAIYSYTAALGGEAAFATASTSVHGLFVDGNVLLGVHSASTTSKVTSWNRTTRAQISTRDSSTWSLFGSSHAPGLNRIFGRSQLISPSDISYSSYTSAGVISATVDSPNHGDYPDATRTWVSGDEVRVYDTSGTVYTSAGLTYVGSLGGTITDVAFNSDVPVVLRGGNLIAYKNNLLEAGRRALSASTGAEVQIDATNAYVFRPGSPDPGVEIVALTALNMPAPNQPLDATGLAYQPHTVFRDRDGLIGLYSVNHQAVFRWSPVQRAYTTPLMLTTAPTYLTYSDVHHRLYMGAQTTVRQMNAAPGAATSTFATTSDSLYGLTTAGEYIYTAYNTGVRCYTAAGTALNQGGTRGGTGNAWDPVKRRMYHFEDELSDAKLIFETIGTDGRIGGTGSWAESSLYNRSFPIRVSPDGGTVVTGEGVVFNTNNLTVVRDIDIQMDDMLWFSGAFVSIEDEGSTVTRLQRWTPGWEREQAILLNGTPLRVLPLSGADLLVITMDGGVPRFHLLDEQLTPQFDSVNEGPEVVTQPLGAEVDYRTDWTFAVEATGSPVLRYQWLKNNVEVQGATAAALILTNVGSGDTGEYKCRVSNGFGTVFSGGGVLFVGPVNPPVYTAGNLLVSSGRRIFEYTPDGVQRSAIQVPVPTSNTPSSRVVGDVVGDRYGRVHVLNEGRRTGTSSVQYYISTFDPRRQLWSHRPVGNLSGLVNNSSWDISISGDWIYQRNYRFNIATSVAEYNYYPLTISSDELTAGLDGRLYGIYAAGSEVFRLRTDLSLLAEYDLGSLPLRGVAGDAAGRFYVCDANNRIGSYSASGSSIKSLTPSGAFNGLVDVSISPGGRLACGGISGLIAVTDTELTAPVTINPGTSAVSYTAWAPAVATPAPALASAAAPPAATEDVLYTWTPGVTHPDPDAVLTLTMPVRPVWLTVAGTSVTGTPLQAHVGANPVRVRATDATGVSVERDFTIFVTEVNDRPSGADQTVAADEDAAPVTVDLATVFSDEETPAAALNYEIAAITGSAAVPTLQGGALRLTFPADANGDTTVTLRATDAGGLTADAVFSVSVRAVNDAPAFTAPQPDVNAGPAAPDAFVELATLMRDPDAGDTHSWRITGVSNADIFSSLSIDATGRLAVRYAPYRSGTAVVNVEVRDATGEIATLTFNMILPELPAPQLAVSDALVLNRQTGLWEHRITLRNDAERAIGGFEVKVTNLPAGACLYNASECSASVQLAGYYAPLAPGATVTMVLEYYHPARGAVEPRLEVTTALPRVPPPAASGGLAVDKVMAVPGGVLLEFSALPAHLYLVQYSDNGMEWMDSMVRIRAAGNRVQWLDQGPPRTHAAPLAGGHRFYRVKEVTAP